jgi:hypothetical protein
VTGLAARGILYAFGPALGRADLRPYAAHQWRALAALLGMDGLAARVQRPGADSAPASLGPNPSEVGVGFSEASTETAALR